MAYKDYFHYLDYCALCDKPLREGGKQTDTLVTTDLVGIGKARASTPLPGLKSPYYDARYGVLVHKPCFDQYQAKKGAK